jgi:hypothetical protein
LSIRVAVAPAGGGAGLPSGGKTRRRASLLVLPTQPGPYVDRQGRLVVLDREDVVPAAVADGRADVFLAKHRVAGDDAVPHGQYSQQLQGRLVFVGLGVDPDLLRDGLPLFTCDYVFNHAQLSNRPEGQGLRITASLA